MGQHRRVKPWYWRAIWIGLPALFSVVVALLVVNSLLPGSTETPAAPVMQNQTHLAEVISVESPTIVTVRTIDNTEIRVSVIGIQDPPSCAYQSSLTYVRGLLGGQRITLVPDPGLPSHTRDGQSLYHVVLRSQLSYSDAAISTGNALVAPYDSTYRSVYEREQTEAKEDERGVWGPPCSELETSRTPGTSSTSDPSSTSSESTASISPTN